MGFHSVYRVLQDVFPQVDSRALRAVAIEHSKDADVAVEVVLVEVIPYLSKQSTTHSSSNESGSLLNFSEEAVVDADTTARTNDAHSADSACLDESVNGSSFYDANGGNDHVCGDNGNDELISVEKFDESTKVGADMSSHVTSITLIHENGANDYPDQVFGNSETEEIISLPKCKESSVEVIGTGPSSHVRSTTFKHGDTDANGSMSDCLRDDWEDLNRPVDSSVNMAIHGESQQEHSCIDGNPLEVKNSVVHVAPSPHRECTPNTPESSLQLVFVPDMLITDFKKPESSVSVDDVSKKDISTSEMVVLEDESPMNAMVARSGQICIIDLLEGIIEDARGNKKTLSSAMDSVISLMREVELQENIAEQAKEEAARGGLDICARVEDLEQHLGRAKEANDMFAGEVYGEKAILATEVRELQSRLLNMSDERDKSLAILDEMRQTLEVRSITAEKEMKAAELEKLEKEESARKALVDQQLIMEKVVLESETLKQEAEVNSKLREFLMDRGRVVDMLQGEISVKCQDVKLLKEKFDERAPLSKYLSSSQASCILASSSSRLKGMAPDSYETPKKTCPTTSTDRLSFSNSSLKRATPNQVPELVDSSETPKKTSAMPSVDDQLSSGEYRTRDECNALVEDGWEFFDNCEAR